MVYVCSSTCPFENYTGSFEQSRKWSLQYNCDTVLGLLQCKAIKMNIAILDLYVYNSKPYFKWERGKILKQ